MKKNLFLFLFVFIWLQNFAVADIFDKGASIHGFCVTNSLAIEDRAYHLTELEHEKSGARIVHIWAPDPENFFSIAFCTPNDSSNGVAHVLEHSVLQGSKKYPDHNLFYKLAKSSLGSYINAATASAFTFYLAASTHEQDFYNLLEVYCDAVFNPLLHPFVFYREGYRLEFTDATCEKLVYKGIVHNEMKGANSSPYRRLTQRVSAALFPDTAHAYNYGGVAQELVGLSYDTLVCFHKENYYPGNAFLFLYGDIPLEKHLAFLDKLQIFEGPKKGPKKGPKSVAKQKPFTEKVFQKHLYPAAKDSDQTLMALSWVQDIRDTEEFVLLEVLDAALFQTDAALLKSKLLESGLCSNAHTSKDPDKTQALYELILEVSSEKDTENVQALVFDTLKSICEEGIDESLIESVCQRLLFEASEVHTVGMPMGYSLFVQCVQQKNLGFSLQELFQKRLILEKIQRKAKEDSSYFSALIKKHFLDNTHFATIVLTPSSVLLKEEHLQEEKALDALLQKLSQKLSQDERQEIIEVAKKLQDDDEQAKKTDVLPTISIDMLSQEDMSIKLFQERVGALDLFYYDTPTNGITYADLVMHLPQVPADDLWLFQLYADLLPELGWGKHSAKETLKAIQKNTAGIDAYVKFVPDAKEETCSRAGITGQLHIQAKAFDYMQQALFSLFSDLSEHVDFNFERVKELVHRYAVSLQHRLTYLASGYAESQTLQAQSPLFYFIQETRGLGYFQKLQKLDSSFDTQGASICAKLKALHKSLFSHARAHLLLACNKEAYESGKTHLGALFPQGPCNTPDFFELPEALPQIEPTAYLIASAVAFNAQGVQAPAFCHPQSAYLGLAATLCKNCVLIPSIRQQGGAYHTHASYDASSGTFVLSSNRDPHIARTATVFEKTVEMLSFDEVDLREAKISLIQKLDKPRAPLERTREAYAHLCSGKTDEMRRSWRKAFLTATKEDVSKAIQEHLVEPFKKSVFISFTPRELLDDEQKLVVKNIL